MRSSKQGPELATHRDPERGVSGKWQRAATGDRQDFVWGCMFATSSKSISKSLRQRLVLTGAALRMLSETMRNWRTAQKGRAVLGISAVRLPQAVRAALGFALRRGRKSLKYAAGKVHKHLRARKKARRWSKRQRKAWHDASKSVGRWVLIGGATVRRRISWSTTFIGVTGSCGKTTVANLVGPILRHEGKCLVCLDCNYEADVARTVLALPISARFCVQETATIRPGMMAISSENPEAEHRHRDDDRQRSLRQIPQP